MAWFTRSNSTLPRRLSAEEATQLAAQVAELAKAGLPLESGLRALADELQGGRVSQVLRELAGRLSAGETFEAAFEAQGPRLPAHVRGLVLAAVRSGNLAVVLEEFVDLERRRSELRRQLAMTLAYPIVLLGILLALVLLETEYLTPPFGKIFRDFGTTLPAITRVILAPTAPLQFGGPVALLLAILVLSVAMPDAPGVCRLLEFIPLVGRLWRWSRLAYFSRLMGLLLEQHVPLPEALRLTASGLPHAALAAGCRRAAAEVEAGRPLSASLAEQRQFPPTLIPVIQWGERTPALAEAFRAAAEMFEGRVNCQEFFLAPLLLPALLMVIGGSVGLTVVALYLPLISLIQHLT